MDDERACIIDRMKVYEAEVRDIRASSVAANTRTVYEGSHTKFIQWAYENKPHLLSESCLSILNSNARASRYRSCCREWRRVVKDIVRKVNTEGFIPLKFELITAQDFLMWMVLVPHFLHLTVIALH